MDTGKKYLSCRDTLGKYEKLIGMADPGEKSDDGSLIVQKYGKDGSPIPALCFSESFLQVYLAHIGYWQILSP
jgi:hypothetical protein